MVPSRSRNTARCNVIGASWPIKVAGSTFSHLSNFWGPPQIHDLRHGAASLMAAMGIPPRVAMELLGHSQMATTMNIYAHVAPEYGKEAMERIGKVLLGA